MKSVGIDLHKQTISICTVDQQRRILDRHRFLCRQPARIRAYFAAAGEFQAVWCHYSAYPEPDQVDMISAESKLIQRLDSCLEHIPDHRG